MSRGDIGCRIKVTAKNVEGGIDCRIKAAVKNVERRHRLPKTTVRMGKGQHSWQLEAGPPGAPSKPN
jgi:hypothetical protein